MDMPPSHEPDISIFVILYFQYFYASPYHCSEGDLRDQNSTVPYLSVQDEKAGLKNPVLAHFPSPYALPLPPKSN